MAELRYGSDGHYICREKEGGGTSMLLLFKNKNGVICNQTCEGKQWQNVIDKTGYTISQYGVHQCVIP